MYILRASLAEFLGQTSEVIQTELLGKSLTDILKESLAQLFKEFVMKFLEVLTDWYISSALNTQKYLMHTTYYFQFI